MDDVRDATVVDDVRGGAGWAQLVMVSRPGDVIVIACAEVLGAGPAELRDRIAEIELRGVRVVAPAGTPERIAMRGRKSQ